MAARDILLRALTSDGLPDLPPSGIAVSKGAPTSSKSISLSSSSLPQSTSASSSSSVFSSIVSPTSFTSTTTSSIEASSSSLTPAPVTRTTTLVESFSIAPPAANVGTTSFLQNKLASGFVFAIVGIFALIFVIFIATFFIRRRRNRRLIEEAVSFDPVIVGRVDLEKAKQSSSLGHGSHDIKNINQYSPPPLYYGGSQPPQGGYSAHTGAQLYVPPARYGSPPLSPLPVQQQHQHQHQQHHLSYISAMSSAEDAGPTYGEMRTPVGLGGGHVPEDIRRQYSINGTA